MKTYLGILTMCFACLAGCMISLTDRTIKWAVDAKLAKSYCAAVYMGVTPENIGEFIMRKEEQTK